MRPTFAKSSVSMKEVIIKYKVKKLFYKDLTSKTIFFLKE